MYVYTLCCMCTYRYIQEDILHPTDSLYYHFNKVFETFKVHTAVYNLRGYNYLYNIRSIQYLHRHTVGVKEGMYCNCAT